ncbi:MAG: SDR family oxidoreductase [Burkholderiales bacterium]|nr:SDR family oxidoreductase [Burkholderiales bacterium]
MAKHVFLTGATGTIGSALVPRLLAPADTQVTVLVRARDAADLKQRMSAMHDAWGLSPDHPALARLHALQGDISLPRLGLTELAFDQLAHEATHLIHCAASVKLNMSLEQARATAVAPTQTMLDLAEHAQRAGNLCKVDLVSTVGVWGCAPGHMPERADLGEREFHNTYEATKAEAERVVWQRGANLPITVHRPSMVIGERGSGRVLHFQVFYHLCEFLSGVRTFGVMPDLGDTQLDTIPVDWVADAICWSSDQPAMSGGILHLCSGPERAIALTRLQQRVRQAWQAHGRPVPPLRHVSRRLLERAVPVIGWFAGDKTRRALRGLPPILAYLSERQGFANPQTARTLAAAGLPVPEVDDYLDAVLGYYLSHRTPGQRPGGPS